ncbi:uncharacterized protein LOC129615897 isoform X2 [Condylostylus longicornis]|uniref:uncharacterized protein LOC129615897 isoform X2 n=1 Tax=Condylostylus longicornis TaxID=2530218 RepID=UPI00244E1469|nr:uncharacterized protein LOC129615897 isoform X2 [Condylostylus longicornis]XP_055387285.1 uncharacterized protein LOC129615897 isoform X2 [Condylostylus longicornis]
MRENSVNYYGRAKPKTVYRSLHSSLLALIDILFSSLIIAPLVISYWRGTWELLGHYIMPHQILFSACLSFFIGLFGHSLFVIGQQFLANALNPDRVRLTYYVISRFYTYVYGSICVNGWRGAWILVDLFTGNTQLWTVALVTLIVILLLAGTRGFRNCCATPFALITDYRDGYFEVATMFKTLGSKEPGLYVLDCLFSVLIVGTLVVVAWRGVWVMLDLTLYPTSKALSGWGSLIIGYIIVTVTFATQPTIQWTCEKISGLCRIIVADLFLFISFLGTVNVWRGVWMLIDVYLYSDDHVFSCWLSHSVSFMLLILLNCSNSVLVRGVYIDCEEPNGECVVFPIQYVRLFFQKERLKKHKMYTDSQEEENLIYGNRKLNCNATIVKSGNNNLSNKMKNDNTSIFNDIKPI